MPQGYVVVQGAIEYLATFTIFFIEKKSDFLNIQDYY